MPQPITEMERRVFNAMERYLDGKRRVDLPVLAREVGITHASLRTHLWALARKGRIIRVGWARYESAAAARTSSLPAVKRAEPQSRREPDRAVPPAAKPQVYESSIAPPSKARLMGGRA